MDIIISGNEEIMRVIKEIPINESNKTDKEKFLELVLEIAKGKEKNEI